MGRLLFFVSAILGMRDAFQAARGWDKPMLLSPLPLPRLAEQKHLETEPVAAAWRALRADASLRPKHLISAGQLSPDLLAAA